MIIHHDADQRFMTRAGKLRRHWLPILGAACGCAVGALIVSLYLPKIYRATTYILISDSKIGETSRDSNLQQMAMMPTFVPFLDNDALIGESLKRLRLDEPPYEMTVDLFRRRRYLDVRVPKSTRLLELNIEFPDPRVAAGLANDIAQGAVRFNDRLNATDATSSQEFLKRHLEQAAERLAHASQRRLRVHEEARIEDREKDLDILLLEKDTLYARLQQLRLDLAQNEVRSTSLEQALALEPQTILLRKSVTSDRFFELASEKLGTEEAPMSVTEESLNEIRESLRRDFLNVAVSSAAQSAGVEAATARLEQLNEEISQLLLLLIALRSKIATADQDYALASEAVKNASREYEAASVTVSSKSQDMKQIAPARAPERPVRPKVLVNTLLGFLVGALAFGCAIAGLESYRELQQQSPAAREDTKFLTARRN